MHDHAIPCGIMQYRAIPYITLQYHSIPFNTTHWHTLNSIQYNTIQYHTKSCNTMQYHAISCNTMQYYASLISADGAYLRPVGSMMAFLQYVWEVLGRCSTNQKWKFRWFLPLGVEPPPPLYRHKFPDICLHLFFVICNCILQIWDGFYTSKISILSPLLIGSESIFISSSGRWLPTI